MGAPEQGLGGVSLPPLSRGGLPCEGSWALDGLIDPLFLAPCGSVCAGYLGAFLSAGGHPRACPESGHGEEVDPAPRGQQEQWGGEAAWVDGEGELGPGVLPVTTA